MESNYTDSNKSHYTRKSKKQYFSKDMEDFKEQSEDQRDLENLIRERRPPYM